MFQNQWNAVFFNELSLLYYEALVQFVFDERVVWHPLFCRFKEESPKYAFSFWKKKKGLSELSGYLFNGIGYVNNLAILNQCSIYKRVLLHDFLTSEQVLKTFKPYRGQKYVLRQNIQSGY